MNDAADTRRRWAAFLLGFSLSGFFDGILLHQILQWHHLLLGWQDGVLRDMNVQLAADGVFHLLMYGLTLVALWLLWSSRDRAREWPGRRVLALALLGFGSWHVLDAVLSHWLLGIHRIRMDSPDPLFWDLLWVGLFGLVPVAIGLWLRRTPPGASPGMGGRAMAGGLAIGALVLGAIAARPPVNADAVLVVLRPGADVNRTLDAVAALQGGILWAHRGGSLWAFKVAPGSDYASLYESGALLVTASPAALGCLGWTRPGPATAASSLAGRAAPSGREPRGLTT